MTRDIKEAFLLATVRFIHWHTFHEEMRTWSNVGHGGVDRPWERSYKPLPTVELFGREVDIRTICHQAKVLSGPVPLWIQSLVYFTNRHSDREIQTFTDAVEYLEVAIEQECHAQRDQPLHRPTLVDQIRDAAWAAGSAEALWSEHRDQQDTRLN